MGSRFVTGNNGPDVARLPAWLYLGSSEPGEGLTVAMPKDVARARQRLLDGLPLSTGQVAALAGVDTKTVGNWVRSGRLEATKTPGGHHLIAASEVRVKVLGAQA